MLKKLLCTLLLLCGLTLSSTAQTHDMVMPINGASTSVISDETAYSLWFASATANPDMYRVGLSSQDAQTLSTSLSSFNSSYMALTTSQNSSITTSTSQLNLAVQRSAALVNEVQSLQNILSAEGTSWLAQTVQAAKNQITQDTTCSPFVS